MADRAEAMRQIMIHQGRHPEHTAAEAWASMMVYADQLGVPVIVEPSGPDSPYGWDGKRIRIEKEGRDDRSYREAYDLAHELGHYICANPGRRTHNEFGLGVGFSTFGELEGEVSYSMADFEEQCACMVASVLLRAAELDVRSESEHTSFIWGHSMREFGDPLGWNSNKTRAAAGHAVDHLIQWGVLTEELTYTGAVRRAPDLTETELFSLDFG